MRRVKPSKPHPWPSCSATSLAAQRPVFASQHVEAQSASEPQLPVMNWVPGALPGLVPGAVEETTGALAALVATTATGATATAEEPEVNEVPAVPPHPWPSSWATSKAAQRRVLASQHAEAQSESSWQGPVMNWVPVEAAAETVVVAATGAAAAAEPPVRELVKEPSKPQPWPSS